MTIPRKDTVGIKPSTKKTGDFDRFHNRFVIHLFYLKNKHLLLTIFFEFDIYKL